MSEPDKNCIICGGDGVFDRPMPNSQVEFNSICDCCSSEPPFCARCGGTCECEDDCDEWEEHQD